MRFATPVVALIAAATLAGCGNASVPKPDPAGDAGFVAALKELCSKTPPLVPLDPSASAAAVTSAAHTNNATVVNFVYGTPVRAADGRVERHGGMAALTPGISSTSPLAVPATNAALMLLDMSRWYTLMLVPASTAKPRTLTRMSGKVTARETQARNDLSEIGITGCPAG